jgi:hypothetical protein
MLEAMPGLQFAMPDSHGRTFLSSIILIGQSLLILGAVVLLVRTAALHRLFAHAVILAIPAAALWAGFSFYNAFADKQPPSSYAPRSRNWGPLTASVVIGIATALFVASMFTHQTVRAIDSILSSDNDD